MDIALIIIGGICIILGLIGCLLPILPGPPLSYIGLLLLHFTRNIQYSKTLLIVLGVLTILVTILDYVLPLWLTKLTGGTKYGMWGATIGLIAGLFLPPIGIIGGPFIGAFVGEILGNNNSNTALMSAFGSFLGFICSTGLKLVLATFITYYFIKELVINFF